VADSPSWYRVRFNAAGQLEKVEAVASAGNQTKRTFYVQAVNSEAAVGYARAARRRYHEGSERKPAAAPAADRAQLLLEVRETWRASSNGSFTRWLDEEIEKSSGRRVA